MTKRGKYKRKLRKLDGKNARQIFDLVSKTNLRIAAKILGVSDKGLRKFLIRENLYNSLINIGKALNQKNRQPTLNIYSAVPERKMTVVTVSVAAPLVDSQGTQDAINICNEAIVDGGAMGVCNRLEDRPTWQLAPMVVSVEPIDGYP